MKARLPWIAVPALVVGWLIRPVSLDSAYLLPFVAVHETVQPAHVSLWLRSER